MKQRTSDANDQWDDDLLDEQDDDEGAQEYEDESDRIRHEGELLAELHWDSGGPGAGAGVVQLFGYKGKFYLQHDAGMTEFDTAHEALRAGGFLTSSDATVRMYVDLGIAQ